MHINIILSSHYFDDLSLLIFTVPPVTKRKLLVSLFPQIIGESLQQHMHSLIIPDGNQDFPDPIPGILMPVMQNGETHSVKDGYQQHACGY